MVNPRKNLRFGMLHYHLKPGGVTSVIRDICSALRRHSRYESIQIDILSSTPRGDRAKSLFGWEDNDDVSRLRIEEIPSLAYNRRRYPDRLSFMQAADNLAHDVLGRLDLEKATPDCPYVLHSHNISLGKNPTATMAFKRIAEIADDRSLPLWLINHVHDFAENNRPDGMEAFFNCTGRRDELFALTFMYPVGRNIIYVVINSADTGNLTAIGIPGERIFVLPDPIDIVQYEQVSLCETEAEEMAALGLSPADYREICLRRITEYAEANKQRFDNSLPILLSPVKVMRRKNNIETLLLLMLFRHLGRSYQLMTTLGPNSPPDIAFSRVFESVAESLNLPVVTGFGRELISAAGKRLIRKGRMERFSMRDLHDLSDAVVTTSIVEGFGLAYHEGWLSGRIVVGRKIHDVVRDFTKAGMRFYHMYDRLAVSLADLPNLRQRLLDAYEEKIRRSGPNYSKSEFVPPISASTVIKEKVFRAGGTDCIDFADLSSGMQAELLERLERNPELASEMIDRNPLIVNMFHLLQGCTSELERAHLLRTNQEVIHESYSLEAAARRMENILKVGDSLYRNAWAHGALTPENHAPVILRYRKPGNLRLLF